MSSEQRTARETLIDYVQHKAYCECVRSRTIYGVTMGEGGRCTCGLRDAIAALRAAPAPEPEHVCGGCGYKWNWPVPSPIELCGDCWRKTWPNLRGAAPAPTDVAPTLIRYLDEQFGLALRPEHAREIRRILAADRTQPIETPPENRPQPRGCAMTDRETLEQLIDRAEVMLMSRSHPPNAENLAADLDERTQLGYDLLAALRAAPAPTGDYSKVEQDCRGCMGPCGRCHELDGAAPAPEGETPTVEDREQALNIAIGLGITSMLEPERREDRLASLKKARCLLKLDAPASPGPTALTGGTAEP
jgi:hypothetical protein